MTLRVRLVLALLALLGTGLVVYGVASYQAFARSELARLDEQVSSTVPVAERELIATSGLALGTFDLSEGFTGEASPRVVISPGTYAEVRDPAGRLVGTPIQFADDRAQPDLTDVDPREGTQAFWTVPSLDAATEWRVAAHHRPDGLTVLVAVPMTSVAQALDRLLGIELVAGAVLLVVLGVGAWLVLRSGLRPLERMATTARTITAGSLDQRVPVPDEDTEVRHLGTALNGMLNDLEQAFQEREATEAKLRRFLSDASHELRTPLTSIQGYAELFRLGAGNEQVDLELVMGRIEGESARMRALVENLLALARLDERATPIREPVDLVVLADDVCTDAAAVDPERPIELDAPTPVLVEGDAGHLRQAISNLVTNALRHTPPRTPVAVGVHREGDRATVSVRDRGEGLAPTTLAHAFDRFWQADPSRVGSGTGLGLSIVQAIAEEHDGAADVTNAADGGALFTLVLPADRPPASADADVDGGGQVDAAVDRELGSARVH